MTNDIDLALPVDTDGDKNSRGEIISESSDCHQDLAGHIARPPLDGEPPGSLQREDYEADDRVGECEMEDKVVHVGPRPQKYNL